MIRELWYRLRAKRVWKVILPLSPEGAYSTIVYGKALVRYSTENWVEAPQWLSKRGYDLCCFLNVLDAMLFAYSLERENNRPYQVWEARAIGLKRELPPRCREGLLASGTLTMYTIDAHWARGTFMAEKIKLVKRVT